VLSESAATLVLDHKARVVYATDKLATMLGYPVASLLKMELGALLPQPHCQLYKPWLSPVVFAAHESQYMGCRVNSALRYLHATVPRAGFASDVSSPTGCTAGRIKADDSLQLSGRWCGAHPCSKWRQAASHAEDVNQRRRWDQPYNTHCAGAGMFLLLPAGGTCTLVKPSAPGTHSKPRTQRTYVSFSRWDAQLCVHYTRSFLF
jgi:hypothetical protein